MALFTVVADDLTGALDTGVKFCGEGRTVLVRWSRPLPACDVLVIDTDSRDLTAAEAAETVTRWAPALVGPAFKKVDSTLRGPFAAESWALAESVGARGVLLAPASPAVGRVVRDGRLLVHGRPPAEGGPAGRVRAGRDAGSIAAIIRDQVATVVGHVGRALLDAGPGGVADALADRDGIVVADAESHSDLMILARALRLAGCWLPAGSAGLAQAAAAERGWHADRITLSPNERPLLAACGSFNPVSAAQVVAASHALGLTPVVASQREETAAALLRQLHRCGSALGCLPAEPAEPRSAATALDALAWATAEVAREAAIPTLFVTGGETLRRVCDHLGVTGLAPCGEVEAGVVVSTATVSRGSALTFVSRAGGFGGQDLLARLMLGRTAGWAGLSQEQG